MAALSETKGELKNTKQATERKKRYTRAAASAGLLTLTPVKVQMLRFLAEMRFLSLPQLAQLCCPSEREDLSQKSARKHLRTMFDAGLVNVLPVSRLALSSIDAPNDATLLYGSAPNVYVPTTDSLEMLYKAGLISREWVKRTPVAYGPKNSLFLAHELQVREVRVWLETCARASGGEQKVLVWKEGQEAAIDLGQDCRQSSVRPDAWFIYQVRSAQDETSKPTLLVAFVEIDRGTERGAARWKEKIDAYSALFANGGLQNVTGYRNARILVFTPEERRAVFLSQLFRDTAGMLTSKLWIAERRITHSKSLLEALWIRPTQKDAVALL